MNLVYDQAFGAKTPTYSTVLQLDRKLRGFAVPASLQIAGFGNSESRVGSLYESVPLILQCHLVLAIQETSELCQPVPFDAPTSLNPIVPLPLPKPEEQQVHPYVLQYLLTFVPSPPNGPPGPMGPGPGQAGPSQMNGQQVSPTHY